MKYDDLWQKVFNRQSEILKKELNNEDTNAQKAAQDIINYRAQLINRGMEIDLITEFSMFEAKRIGNNALKLGLDYRGEPYFDLASLLDVNSEIFREAGVWDDEYMDMISKVHSRMIENKDKSAT